MIRSGTRLGIDVGKARIGVARSDPHALLATPVETVPRDHGGDADIARIQEIAAETNAIELVVGLPINLHGNRTLSTEDAEALARRLASAVTMPVRMVDERLSTTEAQGQLRRSGRNAKNSRSIIDQAAAVVILQHALDTERARGIAPGSTIECGESA